jgi:hypothetical protein
MRFPTQKEPSVLPRDFLLQRGRELVAIEVKASSKPQVKDFAYLERSPNAAT